jgi:hypothetical protein
MRKFNTVFKEKQNESIKNHEDKVLNEFKDVYAKLLENYNITSLNVLNESSKTAFMSQINEMWNDEIGLSDKGKKFLNDNCLFLTENSTPAQKKHYLKQKSAILLKESFRQYDLKFKFYDIIDAMYEQVKGDNLGDVLTPTSIMTILGETFNEVATEFLRNIQTELKESAKK